MQISRRRLLAGGTALLVTARLEAKVTESNNDSGIPPRLYRRDVDSRRLTDPRVFTRVFCGPDSLLPTVRFYEALVQRGLDQDLDLPAAGLHVVAVGPFLILAIDPSLVDREAHGQAEQTKATIIVPYLEDTIRRTIALGAEAVGGRFSVPHATGQRLRHPDGTLVEYLEHRPSAFDTDKPGPMFSAPAR